MYFELVFHLKIVWCWYNEQKRPLPRFKSDWIYSMDLCTRFGLWTPASDLSPNESVTYLEMTSKPRRTWQYDVWQTTAGCTQYWPEGMLPSPPSRRKSWCWRKWSELHGIYKMPCSHWRFDMRTRCDIAAKPPREYYQWPSVRPLRWWKSNNFRPLVRKSLNRK